MRKYGEIDGVLFVNEGFDIYNLLYKFKININGDVSRIYVSNMKDLRKQIADKITEEKGFEYGSFQN